MKTRNFSLLLPGLALLGMLLPLSSAHANPTAQILTATEGKDPSYNAKQFLGDKKKPKPTPGPQDGDDN